MSGMPPRSPACGMKSLGVAGRTGGSPKFFGVFLTCALLEPLRHLTKDVG